MFATIKLGFNLRMQSIRLCVSITEHEQKFCDGGICVCTVADFSDQ